MYDRDGDEPWGVLTGDALFVGDVGRPDLLASAGWTSDQLARRLYRSLHDKLLTLPDATRVFPAHGAGSACGKHMASATESTIGEQRATNYALQAMSEDDFAAVLTEGQPLAPLYFAFAADANRRTHQLLDDHEPTKSLMTCRCSDLCAKAPCSSIRAHRTSSLPDTYGARSTSRSTVASPIRR